MLSVLKQLAKRIPTLLMSLALGVAVWISAVTAADPVKEQVYPRPVPLELIGQDPGLLLVSNVPTQVTVTLSAPNSIWDRILNATNPVRAVADLSGLAAGSHVVPVQIQVAIRPVEIRSYTPQSLDITLEAQTTRSIPVHLIQNGDLAIGFQSDPPVLSTQNVTISGPESNVARVHEVRALLDITDAKESINRSLNLQALDASGQIVDGVTLSPNHVTVTMNITQRGGYRNVVVKVVFTGQVASGYRVTNISVYPPAVTVFSSNPSLIDSLPGYIETQVLDIGGARDDIDQKMHLNLPTGVSLIGSDSVEVQVGIAAITGSITLTNMQVEMTGLDPALQAVVSPTTVDVILSGPLPVLDKLRPQDVHVVIDLTGIAAGTYQRTPKVELTTTDLQIESILPGTVEITVTIRKAGSGTPTVTLTGTVTGQPSVNKTQTITPTP